MQKRGPEEKGKYQKGSRYGCLVTEKRGRERRVEGGEGGGAYVLRQRLHRRKRKWGDAYSVGSCNGACWLSQRGGAPPLWSGAKRQEGKEGRGEGWRRTYRPEGVDTLSIVVAIDNSLENSIKRFRLSPSNNENPRLSLSRVTRTTPPLPSDVSNYDWIRR